MSEQTTDNGENVDNELTNEPWYQPIVGDEPAPERVEMLKQFETPDALFEEFNSLKNRDWRDGIAGDDEKFKSTLNRFKTEGDFGNAFREAQQKIRSGELKPTPPGKDATEEDIKAYREQNGIPLESKQYLENLPEGLVLGEDDLPIAQVFMDALHEAHAPVEYGHALIAKYNDFQEQQQDALAEADAAQHEETTDTLREEWGSDYRANINAVGGLLDRIFGKEAKEQLLHGRFQDGRGFMNDSKVLQGLADIAHKIDPTMRLVPPGDTDSVQSLNDEIAEIEKIMKDDRPRYNGDQKMQERLRELYDIRIKHEAA